MSLLDFLTPKWKRDDPGVRLAAVGALTNQSTLAQIATDDPIEAIRVAATLRLTEQEVLGWLASSAESVRVREAAVRRVTDQALLRRLAACDVSAWVRDRARLQAKLVPSLRERISAELGRLPVTTAVPARPEFSGDADAVGAALLTDARFCVNGQVAGEADVRAEAVEFLAAARAESGEPCGESAQPVSYWLRVTRHGPDAFVVTLRQHRYEMASNAAALGWHHGPGRESRGESGERPAVS